VRLSTRRRFSAISNASSILTTPPSYAASPLTSTIFHGIALEKRKSGRKHWKAVEAKLLQNCCKSTYIFFVGYIR
jgi:hypothetical protein